jgi:hypothetical protein
MDKVKNSNKKWSKFGGSRKKRLGLKSSKIGGRRRTKRLSLKMKNKTCPLQNKCAPGAHPNPKTCSCLSREALIKIATEWNNNNTDKINFKPKSTTVYLWDQINDKMKDKCNNEWCWVQQEFVKRIDNEDIKNSYKPIMPKSWKSNRFEWLNTDDIENVMSQYEQAHPDFIFIGPVPIDFDKPYGIGHCVVDELCKVNLAKLYKSGYRKLGIVFNLDPHDKPGSHWVCMFCDMKKNKGLYYFDSYGMQPPKEVDILMKRLQNQAKLFNMKLKIRVNNVRHQYKNSECGVYCLFFITELLKGHRFAALIKSPILDETMNNKRKYFFNET